jgi:hypothetical protein
MERLESRTLLAAVAWDGGGDGTSWHDPLNWDNDQVPVAADDATINVAGAPTIVFSAAAGARSVNSLVCAETIHFTGGSLAVLTTATMTGGALALVDGGTLNGGTWNVAAGDLWFGASTSSTLNGVTLQGTARLVVPNAFARVVNGLSLSGTIIVDANDARLVFAGTQTLLGAPSGEVRLAGGVNVSTRAVEVEGSGAVLTVGAGATIRSTGQARIAAAAPAAGQRLVNQGTIAVDAFLAVSTPGTGGVPGVTPGFHNAGLVQVNNGVFNIIGTSNWINTGTITATGANAIVQFLGGPWQNTGTVNIVNATLYMGGSFTTAAIGTINRTGGLVRISGTLNNTGSTLTLNATTGSWELLLGEIIGGTVNATGGAALRAGPGLPFSGLFPGNALTGVTINGDLTLALQDSFVQVRNGTTFTRARLAAPNATLAIPDSQALNGEVVCEGAEGIRRITSLSGDSATLTIGPGGIIRTTPGFAGDLTIGPGAGFDGVLSLVNQGLISSEVAGRAITLSVPTFTNQGTVQAVNGGSLTITGTLTNLSAGTLTGGSWVVAGSSTLSTPGAITTNAATIVLDGPGSAWGALGGLASNTGSLTLSNDRDFTFAPAGGIFVNSGSFTASGTGTVAVPGGVAFNSAGSPVQVNGATLRLAGGGVHTVGFNLAAGGSLVLDGMHEFRLSAGVGGSGSVDNLGTMLRATPGTTSVAAGVTFSNPGIVEAIGGTLEFNGPMTDIVGGSLNAGTWCGTDPGTIAIVGAVITTNNAQVLLTGPNSVFAAINSLHTNNGIFAIADGRLFSAATFTNTGLLAAANGSVFTVTGQFANSGDVSLPGGTLRALGGGTSSGNVTLLDQGLVEFAGDHALAATADITGDGDLRFSGGTSTSAGTVAISGTARFDGNVETFDGPFQAAVTLVSALSLVTFNHDASFGVLSISTGGTAALGNAGAGLAASVSNAGTLRLGTRLLTVSGAFVQAGAAALHADLAGAAAYGRLVVGAGSTVAGALNVAIINAIVPAIASTFDIVSGTAFSGAFSAVNSTGVPSHRRLNPIGPPGALTLFYTYLTDLDSSGSVTPSDLALFVSRWLASVNAGTLDGDWDGSGTVNPADVAAFVSDWFFDVNNP